MPADIELEDKLAFGLTARQLGLLAATALTSYGLYSILAAAVAPLAGVALAAPVALTGALLALGRLEGLSGDRVALAAARYLRAPRRRVLAPDGLPARIPGVTSSARLAPLCLPVTSILRSGLVALSDGSHCVVLRATGASFTLRSDEEQSALVEAFGRFLNGLADPIEIVVRSEPVELAPLLARLEQQAAALTQPALADAAREHIRFLTELATREGVRRREILLVLTSRQRDRDRAREALERRTGEATEALRTAGVELRPLDGEQTAGLLARALDPPGPPDGSLLDGTVRAC